MPWQVFISISIIFNSLATLVNRLLMKDEKNDSYLFAVIFQAASALLILVIGLLLGRIGYPNMSGFEVNLVLMMLLYGFGSILVFESFKYIEASNFTIVFATRVIIIIVASRIFLSEILGLQQIIGALLILSGVVIVSAKNTKFSLGKGVLYVFLAALFFGFAITNDKYILSSINIDVFSLLVLGFFLPVIPMVILRPNVLKKLPKALNRGNFLLMAVLIVFYVVQALGYYLAIEKTDLSVVASVNQITDVLTVVLAILLLRERDSIDRKIVGVGLSFAGLLLI